MSSAKRFYSPVDDPRQAILVLLHSLINFIIVLYQDSNITIATSNVFFKILACLCNRERERERENTRFLLILSLPGKALRMRFDIARLAERFNRHSQSGAW